MFLSITMILVGVLLTVVGLTAYAAYETSKLFAGPLQIVIEAFEDALKAILFALAAVWYTIGPILFALAAVLDLIVEVLITIVTCVAHDLRDFHASLQTARRIRARRANDLRIGRDMP